MQAVQKKLKDLWHKGQGTRVRAVLTKLNPVIRGWANYYRTVVATETFHYLDNWMYFKAECYARQMHPNKSKGWRHQRYWGCLHLDRCDSWVFGDKQTGGYLLKFRWFPIERHTLVKGTASPDDPRLKDYWAKRQAMKAKDLTRSKQKLAKRQQSRCPECGETLFNDEELQIHHLLAQSQGGKDTYGNLVLVHFFCHQHIHARMARAMSNCQHVNDQDLLAEEKPTNLPPRQEKKKELCCT